MTDPETQGWMGQLLMRKILPTYFAMEWTMAGLGQDRPCRAKGNTDVDLCNTDVDLCKARLTQAYQTHSPCCVQDNALVVRRSQGRCRLQSGLSSQEVMDLHLTIDIQRAERDRLVSCMCHPLQHWSDLLMTAGNKCGCQGPRSRELP